MTFKTPFLNSWSIQIFVGKCRFCVFRESTGSTKESYLAYVVFHELRFGKCWELMAMFHLQKKSERVVIYLELKSVKLLLALSIHCMSMHMRTGGTL